MVHNCLPAPQKYSLWSLRFSEFSLIFTLISGRWAHVITNSISSYTLRTEDLAHAQLNSMASRLHVSKLQGPRCNWEFQCRGTGHSVKLTWFPVNFHCFPVELNWISSGMPLNFQVAPGSLYNQWPFTGSCWEWLPTQMSKNKKWIIWMRPDGRSPPDKGMKSDSDERSGCEFNGSCT